MDGVPIVFSLFLIFTGATLLGIIVLHFKQSLIVAYIATGLIIGPSCLKLINDTTLIDNISTIGIIFLLFIVGLHLKPKKLVYVLKMEFITVLLSSMCFFVVGFIIPFFSGFNLIECTIIGMTLTFSSTIISLNLLPANELEEHPIGDIMISILLIQDLFAILLILILQSLQHNGSNHYLPFLKVFFSLPFLFLAAYLFQKYILIKLYKTFKKPTDFVFLLSIGWCLGIAELAHCLGLSYELGALLAGLSLAKKKTSFTVALHLKPVCDFFLILYFFSIGADFNLQELSVIWLPALILAIIIIFLKPLIFKLLLQKTESKTLSKEVGIRLGQASEFSLLSSIIAYHLGIIQEDALFLIQATTIITFILSPILTINQYPEKQESLDNV